MNDATPLAIDGLGAAAAERRIDELAHMLVDAVASGASVDFMADFAHRHAIAFWHGQLPGIASGERRLFVAETSGRLVATTILTLAWQPNAPRRGEITKMLVHSSMRRRGVGRRILAAAEDEARRLGRTLLLLDTESDGAGDRLYRAGGWTEYGRVPGHALKTNGRLAETVMFYKHPR